MRDFESEGRVLHKNPKTRQPHSSGERADLGQMVRTTPSLRDVRGDELLGKIFPVAPIADHGATDRDLSAQLSRLGLSETVSTKLWLRVNGLEKVTSLTDPAAPGPGKPWKNETSQPPARYVDITRDVSAAAMVTFRHQSSGARSVRKAVRHGLDRAQYTATKDASVVHLLQRLLAERHAEAHADNKTCPAATLIVWLVVLTKLHIKPSRGVFQYYS